MKIRPIKAVDLRVSNQDIQHSHHKLSAWKFLVAIIMVLFVLCFSVFRENINVLLYDGPSQIKTLADQSGMSTHGKALFFSTSPEIVDYPTLQKYCPLATNDTIEFGCYINDKNKIYILNIQNSDLSPMMAVTAAHEMLHKAYAGLTDSDRVTLIAEITAEKTLILSDPGSPDAKHFNEMLQPYIDTGASSVVLDNELDSLLGTEINVNSSSLISYYDQYFTSQSVPVSQYSLEVQNIETITNQLNVELGSVNSCVDDIASRDANLNSIQKALDYDSYIGDTNTYNQNVDIYNTNLANFKTQYTNCKTQYDAYNAKVQDYNDINVKLKAPQQLTSTSL